MPLPSPANTKNAPRFEFNRFQEMSQSVSPAAPEVTALADGSVSDTEFLYLDGLTGNIQVQLDALASSVSYKSSFLLMGG